MKHSQSAPLLLPITVGLGLLRHGSRGSRIRTGLMAVGMTVATVLLLIGLAVPAIQQHRAARLSARTAQCTDPDGGPLRPCGLAGSATADEWYSRALERQLIASDTHDPPPPGVARLPAAGEIVVSPALDKLLTGDHASSLLKQRYPERIVGVISKAGLAQPDELLAYVGVKAADAPPTNKLLGYQSAGVSSHASVSFISLAAIAAIVLLPVLLFMAACSRLSAATRDRKLAALRLLGFTPTQTQICNAIEPAVTSIIGAAAGLGIFEVLRTHSAGLTIGGYGWFASDANPPMLELIGLLLAIPLLTIGVGVFAVRRRIATIRSGRMAAPVRRMSPARLVPILLGATLSGYVIRTAPRAGQPRNSYDAPLVLAAIVLLAIGLVLVTPWITAVIATGTASATRSVPVLLASRRLQLESTTAARAISGVVLLLFMTTFAQSVVLAIRGSVIKQSWLAAVSDNLYEVQAAEPGGPPLEGLLASIPGVTAVVPVEWYDSGELATLAPGTAQAASVSIASPIRAIVMSCAQLRVIIRNPPPCTDGQTYGLTEPPDPNSVQKPVTLHPAVPASPTSGPASAVSVGPGAAAMTLPDPRAQRALQADFVITRTATDSIPTQTYYFHTNGNPTTLERVRSAIAGEPATTVSLLDDAVGRQYDLAVYNTVIALGAAITLSVAFAALLIGAVDRANERRGYVAVQSAIGVPLRTLRQAQIIQVLLPYSVGVALAFTFSKLASNAYAHAGNFSHSIAATSLIVPATISVAGAVLIALSTLPALHTSGTAEAIHQN